MYPESSPARGFTLLELMVVMVLISIMTAFAVPKIRSSLFSDQLKSTARKLVGLVAETSQDAVRNQIPYHLVFDSEAHAFVGGPVRKLPDDEERGSRGRLVIPDAVQVVDVSSAHGGTRTLGELEIAFTKKGYVDKTLIHLRDDDGREMTIMLSPFLGVTRIFDSYLELQDEKLQ
ncbi:MAG: prepilin-type N-terminal cleavage/methylation domain-containing protein [Desulfobulbaceae bacterium]|nr:prepilin-type N-terminal cleavage/methylation domain-containing protein [Desulfobulbaceae bacterium]